MEAGRIRVLDGWRAVSIFLVIAAHLAKYSSLKNETYSTDLAYNYALLGVKLFFFISGFVICKGLLEEAKTTGATDVPAFYIRRIARIVPALVIYLAAVVLLWQFGLVEDNAINALRSLTFTCNFTTLNCRGFLGGHTWSLAVEQQFYLIYPLLFAASGRAAASRPLLVTAVLPCELLTTIARGDRVIPAIGATSR